MNLEGFLNQEVSYSPKTGEDEWGAPSYGAPETIPARKEKKVGRSRTADGTEVEVETRLLLVREISPDDLIDDRQVRRVEAIVDVGGSTIGYTAYLV